MLAVPPSHYGYFGPVGTFTHQALLTLPPLRDEPTPYATVGLALQAVRDGEVAAALVPIENSVEGGVSATLDNLTYGDPLRIIREVVLPVQFTLFARNGTQLDDVRRVLTHPTRPPSVATGWLCTCPRRSSPRAARPRLPRPRWPTLARGSTRRSAPNRRRAEQAGTAGDKDRRQSRRRHPICAGLAARAGRPATGADKTTMVLFMRENHPGALLEILEQFASRGVNLCRIESRPTKRSLGDYCFSVDAEGHIDDARLAEAMMGLHRVCGDVVFLGSYPRADLTEPIIPQGTSNEDYAAAATWLQKLRG